MTGVCPLLALRAEAERSSCSERPCGRALLWPHGGLSCLSHFSLKRFRGTWNSGRQLRGSVPQCTAAAALSPQSLTGHTSPVESVRLNTPEELIVAGSQSGSIRVWDLEAAKSRPPSLPPVHAHLP